MITSAFVVVNVAYVVVILALLLTHHIERDNWSKERKELYDRIQSGTLRDYKEQIAPTPEYEPISKTDEDLYELEIEESKR